MKPSLEALLGLCPDADIEAAQEHLGRLPDRYFDLFAADDICFHLQALARLCPSRPWEIRMDRLAGKAATCTVLAFDAPGLFPLLTGLLSAAGFEILSGDAFTYAAGRGGPRKIVDCFSGTVDSDLPFELWAEEFRANLAHGFDLLGKGKEESRRQAAAWVNEKVVERLARLRAAGNAPALEPVEIEVDESRQDLTRLRIASRDSPAFLYSLSSALFLQGVSIEHVEIRTSQGRVQDLIDVADLRGGRISERKRLDRILLSALLTKQFASFLPTAPDPYTALCRYAELTDKILSAESPDAWLEILSDPRALQDLARLLGTSDLLWEDFIRLQWEQVLPLVRDAARDRRLCHEPQEYEEVLERFLDGARTEEEKKDRFNRFKDRELFLIDLDFMVHPDRGFRALSEKLTGLAEFIVNKASAYAWETLVRRYGKPRTASGIEAPFALLGLGKFGGAALGYASDIEVLFLYSDPGETDGPEPIPNAEFYERLAQQTLRWIRTKREGIFQVDLRLRPHGESGPLATSLQAFCEYYGPGGQAHSYERLALARLRAVGGDPLLGRRVERIRDEILYGSSCLIRLDEIRELRARQYREKVGPGGNNAKFGPGALVDLEYNVQILQARHGGRHPGLRTPRIHEALEALADAGVLAPEETAALVQAYGFLRSLINSLRMLRGSALDLTLPPPDCPEASHLARRMGYRPRGGLNPAVQLSLDFEAHTAAVRAFAEKHFGGEALPGARPGTVADLVLAGEGAAEKGYGILASKGFANPERAFRNFKALAGAGAQKLAFARLALLAFETLARAPNPDRALNNWERFVRAVPSPLFHFHLLLQQPMRLEVLLQLFGSSQFLADTLVRHPGYLEWLLDPAILRGPRQPAELERELRLFIQACPGRPEWLNHLRRIRRRETLRVGARDLLLGVPTEEVISELSLVAEEILRAALRQAWIRTIEERAVPKGTAEPQAGLCILALGKLGGRELNYSSDVDLLPLRADPEPARAMLGLEEDLLPDLYGRIVEQTCLDLSSHTEEGLAYRVDLRLRPYGSSGELVPTFSGLAAYYEHKASLWEIQAAIKMRPVAGDLDLGRRLVEKIRPVLLREKNSREVAAAIDSLRRASIRRSSEGIAAGLNVKTCAGGIRDVESLVQGLQLLHGPREPELMRPGTLEALEALRRKNVLDEKTCEDLREDYLYLRRLEHLLQIQEDLQTHCLPDDPAELQTLARTLYGPDSDSAGLLRDLTMRLERVRKAYEAHLLCLCRT